MAGSDVLVRRCAGALAQRCAGALGGALWPGPDPPPPWCRGSSTTRLRLRRWLPLVAGLYALVVVIATAGAVLNSSHRMTGGVAFLLLLPYVVGVALAARRPMDGWRLVTLCLLVTPFVIPPPSGVVPPVEQWQWCLWVPVLLFAAMAGPARDALALGVLSLVTLAVLSFLTPWPVSLGNPVFPLLGVAVPLLVGASAAGRWTAQRALHEEQARAETALAERAALAERTRIAREMHDVVAHHMSMIAVRCTTAAHRIAGLNDAGRQEITEIGTAARAAMNDMQGLLGVLRGPEPGPGQGASAPMVPMDPQPALGQLGELIAQARATGLRVDADPDPGLDTVAGKVPEAVGLTLYRIAQEALTNARRHAPGAQVSLRLRRRPEDVELTVRSGPAPGPAGARASAGGHGLTGMRERVALHGGELSAGPDSDGGFTVRAVLPVRPG